MEFKLTKQERQHWVALRPTEQLRLLLRDHRDAARENALNNLEPDGNFGAGIACRSMQTTFEGLYAELFGVAMDDDDFGVRPRSAGGATRTVRRSSAAQRMPAPGEEQDLTQEEDDDVE